MAMHKPGDLVWAKMKGFPPWPAMVLSISDVNSPTPNGRQPVLFYGTQETAFMRPNELYAYRQFRDQYEVPRKLKGFNQGIREIRMEAGIEEDDDMDAKFPIIGSATPIKSGAGDGRADSAKAASSSFEPLRQDDLGQTMRPISDTTLKVFPTSSPPPSPGSDNISQQAIPKLKISFGGPAPLVTTPTETEMPPTMTSSGRVRRPSTKFSPDDYYSIPTDRPKKQQIVTAIEQKAIKTEPPSSNKPSTSTTSASSAGKIKFKSMMKRKEERERKKSVESPPPIFEPIRPEKRPRADSSLRDASKPKRIKRVSISDKLSYEPFSSLAPLSHEAFDIGVPSSSSNIVSSMDPTLLSPMLSSVAVPFTDNYDSGNVPLLEPSLVGDSGLRHSRRTPKPKSFDDFVTSTKSSGRERASDSISGGLSAVMMRSPARTRGLSISSTRTRLTSGTSDVFEEIGLSIEPITGFSAADLVSAQAAGFPTIELNRKYGVLRLTDSFQTDDGMSDGSGRDVATPEEPLPMPAPLKLCVDCGCECRVVSANDGTMKWRCTSKYCLKWNGKYEAFSFDTSSSADEKSSKGGRSRSSPRRSESTTPQRFVGSTARSGVRTVTESSEESLEDAETEAMRRMQWLASMKEAKRQKKKEAKPPPPPVNTTTPNIRRSATGRPKSYKVEMTPPVSASGQRHCTYCNGQVRPQMCGGNKHRWRCVDKKCRKWYGWVRSNEEIPNDLGKKGRWKDLALKIKRKRLSSSISVEAAAAASASAKKIAKAAAAKVKAAQEDKPKRPIGRPPKPSNAGGLKIKLKTMRRASSSYGPSADIKSEITDDVAPKLATIEHDPHVVANLRLNDSMDSMGSDIQAELNERARILHSVDGDRQISRNIPDEQKQKRKYTKRKNIDVKPSAESLKPPKANKSPSKGLRLVTGIQQVPTERPAMQEPTGMFAENIEPPAASGRVSHRSSFEDLPRDPSPLPEKALHYRMTLVEQKSRWWTSQKARRKSPSPNRTFSTETLDCAASFRIIGRTLGALGERLHNRITDGPPPNETLAVDDSTGAVSGTLDMMMDSLMASFGPLIALANIIPQFTPALNDDTLQQVWEACAVHTPMPQ